MLPPYESGRPPPPWHRRPPVLLAAIALAAAGATLAMQMLWPLAIGAAALAVGALLLCYRGDRTEKDLRASERRYRLVADNTTDLVCVHSLDGIYTWVSPSVHGMAGWTPEELIGGDPYAYFHPDDVERIRSEAHTALLAGATSTTIAYRFRRKDGSWLWLETLSRLLCDETGKPTAIQTASRDISQRKADEMRLAEVQRAAALAERMAAIGTLAGGVAHEFNNLNAVVMGNVELALRRSDLPPEARRRLDSVREAVEREKGIVEALLAFSRSERGATEVADIGRITSTTLALARRTLRQRRVTLAVDLPAEPLFATIPSGSLGQVLLNLLLNACDAIDRRDDPRIWVRLHRQGGRCVLSVRDNGIGIEPELATRIFEPFFSTKGEHASDGHGQPWLRGSGLGLSVCLTLVGQMEGTIAVESRPGEGAIFTVSIPLADAPGPVVLVAPGTTPCARILVVDDEPEIRVLLCEHLVAVGHVVVEAKDGDQALDRLGREEIDLVLLNWSMPGLDGQGVLEHMELHPERRWPPVVVVSGWTGGGSGIDRWRREIAGELRKPFSLEQVRSSVDRALCGQRDSGADDDSSSRIAPA